MTLFVIDNVTSGVGPISGLSSRMERIGPVDSSIVFAPSTEVAQLAMKATKPGGTTVIGVWVKLGQLPFVEKRVVGSVIGSRQDVKEVLNMLKTGQIRARAVLVP